jgi:hypothetical protein
MANAGTATGLQRGDGHQHSTGRAGWGWCEFASTIAGMQACCGETGTATSTPPGVRDAGVRDAGVRDAGVRDGDCVRMRACRRVAGRRGLPPALHRACEHAGVWRETGTANGMTAGVVSTTVTIDGLDDRQPWRSTAVTIDNRGARRPGRSTTVTIDNRDLDGLDARQP